MRGAVACREAFDLLRDRPLLFLPRLVVLTIMSLVWLWFASLIQNPTALVIGDLYQMLAILVLMAPIQLLMYNFYFIVVDQNQDDAIDLREAFKRGVHRLPRAGIVFGLAVAIMTVVSTPGILMVVYGWQTQFLWYVAIGLIGSMVVMLGIATLFYFTPVTVVISDQPFTQAFKTGMHRSVSNRGIVLAITLISFILLSIGTVAEGSLGTIGLIGFVGVRLVNGVISVYLLLVNPALFYELD